MIIQKKTKIISNIHITGDYYRLILNFPEVSQRAKPGQFVHIRVSDGYEPLLRRPFSIHRVSSRVIEILYEVVGRGTKILSEKKVGEYLDILGPLGNGFSVLATRYSLLVAGGIGIAPLLFLAEKIKERQNTRAPKHQIIVLLGANTKDKILCEKEFRDLGCDVKISTDDGSRGFKGRATNLLQNLLSTIDYRLSTIYACGPGPMLKEIAEITQRHKIPCQISLEENMGCGLGACLGCAVKTKDGYKRVCKDGPVFNIDEINWEN